MFFFFCIFFDIVSWKNCVELRPVPHRNLCQNSIKFVKIFLPSAPFFAELYGTSCHDIKCEQLQCGETKAEAICSKNMGVSPEAFLQH